MAVQQARDIVAKALQSGRIDAQEAKRRHDAITRVMREGRGRAAMRRVKIWVADLV